MTDLIKPPPFSRQEIIKRASEVILGYSRCVGPKRAMLGIHFDVMYEQYIYPEYEIGLVEDQDLGLDGDGEKILGLYQPEFNRVFIDRSLKDDPRRVFTCWHEVGGHAILQGDWLRSEMNRIGLVPEVVTTAPMLTPQVEGTLEWQANLFAAHVSAPTAFVSYLIQKTFRLIKPYRYIGPGQYCFALSCGTQYRQVSDFAELCRFIAHFIKNRFGGLSVESLSYRVAESEMVVDTTRRANPHYGFGLKRSARTEKHSPPQNVTRLGEIIPSVIGMNVTSGREPLANLSYR